MDMFSALAEPTRRDILELLAKRGRLSASAIYRKFDQTPPAISQHLKILREAKLVDVKKQAQQRIYQINPKKITELEEWLKQITKIWNERFDRLDKVLAVEKKRKAVKDYGR